MERSKFCKKQSDAGDVRNEPGIYLIMSKATKKTYVGSSCNVKKRLYTGHLRNLEKKRHYNSRLQEHVNEYGLDDLTIHALEYCSVDKLVKREQYYINKIHPEFNIQRIAHSPLGQERWDWGVLDMPTKKLKGDRAGKYRYHLLELNKCLMEDFDMSISHSIIFLTDFAKYELVKPLEAMYREQGKKNKKIAIANRGKEKEDKIPIEKVNTRKSLAHEAGISSTTFAKAVYIDRIVDNATKEDLCLGRCTIGGIYDELKRKK